MKKRNPFLRLALPLLMRAFGRRRARMPLRTRAYGAKRPRVTRGRGAYSDSLGFTRESVPMMHSNSDSIVVRHREFVTNIYSNQAGALRYYGGALPGPNPVGGVNGCSATDATYANSIMSFRVQPGYGIFANSGAPQNPQGAPEGVPGTLVHNGAGGVGPLYYPCPAFGSQPSLSLTGVNAQTQFTQQSIFPWFSKIAQQFEQYRIRGLVLEYVPVTADSSSGTAISAGSVDFYVEYNPVSQSQSGMITNAGDIAGGRGAANAQAIFLNNMWARSCKPSEPLRVPLECARALTASEIKYVTTARMSLQDGSSPALIPGAAPVLSTQGDIRLYDAATIYVCAFGQSVDVTQLGQLWVSYEIELLKPQLNVRDIFNYFIECCLINLCLQNF